MALLTGLVFLNLSFVLTEVSALNKVNKNSALFKNLVQLVIGMAEEEDPSAGESHGEKNLKDIFLDISERLASCRQSDLLQREYFRTLQRNHPLSGVCIILIQPPEA